MTEKTHIQGQWRGTAPCASHPHLIGVMGCSIHMVPPAFGSALGGTGGLEEGAGWLSPGLSSGCGRL
jgi:hypothetical protein